MLIPKDIERAQQAARDWLRDHPDRATYADTHRVAGVTLQELLGAEPTPWHDRMPTLADYDRYALRVLRANSAREAARVKSTVVRSAKRKHRRGS
jgi:hypothetical protein